jgi:hypothetical protein
MAIAASCRERYLALQPGKQLPKILQRIFIQFLKLRRRCAVTLAILCLAMHRRQQKNYNDRCYPIGFHHLPRAETQDNNRLSACGVTFGSHPIVSNWKKSYADLIDQRQRLACFISSNCSCPLRNNHGFALGLPAYGISPTGPHRSWQPRCCKHFDLAESDVKGQSDSIWKMAIAFPELAGAVPIEN